MSGGTEAAHNARDHRKTELRFLLQREREGVKVEGMRGGKGEGREGLRMEGGREGEKRRREEGKGDRDEGEKQSGSTEV